MGEGNHLEVMMQKMEQMEVAVRKRDAEGTTNSEKEGSR